MIYSNSFNTQSRTISHFINFATRESAGFEPGTPSSEGGDAMAEPQRSIVFAAVRFFNRRTIYKHIADIRWFQETSGYITIT